MNWKTCIKHGDDKPNTWGCPECVRELRDENTKLRLVLDRYMAAAGALHCSPFDLVCIRKYAEAKARAETILSNIKKELSITNNNS